MKYNLLLISLFITSLCFAQGKVVIDFDKDGKKDKANLISSEGGYIVEFSISSQGGQIQKTKRITLGGQKNYLSVKKDVLIISSQFMRGENYFKFRYDKKLKEIILIGYESRQNGTATNDGSGNASYNLLTGALEANWSTFDQKSGKLIPDPTISQILPKVVYTLKEFNNRDIEGLDDISHGFPPRTK